MLYETVILEAAHIERLFALAIDSPLRAPFKYTKCVFANDCVTERLRSYKLTHRHLISDISDSKMKENFRLLFPLLCVAIIELSRQHTTLSNLGSRSLFILRPVEITTLTSLFRIPLLWRPHDGDPWRSPPGHISILTVEDNAYVSGKAFDDNEPYQIEPADYSTSIRLNHGRVSDDLYRTLRIFFGCVCLSMVS